MLPVLAAFLALIVLLVASPLSARPRPSAADSLPAPDSLDWSLAVESRFGERGGGARQLLEPRGLAADAFGRAYVADAGMHRLVRFDRDGAWLGESGGLGSGAGQLRRPVAVALLGASGVAVLDQENQRVVSYDLFGNALGTLVDLAGEPVAAAAGRVRGGALAADRGGALYLADAESDRVLVFDFTGSFLRVLGGYGAQPGQLRRVAGLAATPQGQLLVAERLNARAQRWDASGKPLAGWPLPVRRGPGALAMAADDSGRVAVADEDAGRVLLFDAQGRLLAWLGGLGRPAAVCFLAPGRLAVLESAAGRVTRLAVRPRR
jgi:DNA-binding beta-propeller fold protein YncE